MNTFAVIGLVASGWLVAGLVVWATNGYETAVSRPLYRDLPRPERSQKESAQKTLTQERW